ncbi:MAG: hypothetical protein ACO1PB_13765 [Ramlibacter sp.]
MDNDDQWIDGWSVTDDDRLVGAVHSGAAEAGPRTIVTSPVVRVVSRGELRAAVAFTQSGNTYRLMNPAQVLGAAGAALFIARLSRQGPAQQAGHALDLEETLILQPSVRPRRDEPPR